MLLIDEKRHEVEVRAIMNKRFYEKDREQRREAYLMASKNPWLVWRLQAFRAGYVPPLILGQIPPDLAHVHLGTRQEEYKIDPLIEHANRYKKQERTFLRKTFILLVLITMLLLGLGITLATQFGSSFRIGILEPHSPRVHSSTLIHAD